MRAFVQVNCCAVGETLQGVEFITELLVVLRARNRFAVGRHICLLCIN
jgi:hypothetical protein